MLKIQEKCREKKDCWPVLTSENVSVKGVRQILFSSQYFVRNLSLQFS